jgi:tetratricopeptide (TPR) repeat protein
MLSRGIAAIALACVALSFAVVFAPLPVQPTAPAEEIPVNATASPSATAGATATATATATGSPRATRTPRPTATATVTPSVNASWEELLASERWTQARTAISDRLIEVPDDAAAWDGLGRAEYKLGNHGACISPFEEAWTRGVRNAESARFAGNAELQVGATEKAMAWYTRALEVNPGDPDVLFNVSIVKHQQGDTAAATEILESIRKNSPAYPKMHNVLHNLGVAYIAAEQRAKAYDTLATAAKLAPSDRDIAERIMALKASATADESDAIWLARLDALVAFKPAGRVMAGYQRERGVIQMRTGKFADAAESYRAIAAIAPDDAESTALWVLATLRVDDEAAVTLARTVLPRHERSAFAQYALGKAEMARYGTAEAKRAFEVANRLNPKLEGPYVELAKHALHANDLRAARNQYNRARENEVWGVELRLLGAVILSHLPDRTADATQQFAQFDTENALRAIGDQIDRKQFLIDCGERLVAADVTAQVDALLKTGIEQSTADRNAAIETLTQAATLDANRPDVYMLLGDTYRARGLTGEFVCNDCLEKAITAYEAAIAIGDRAIFGQAYASTAYCHYRMVKYTFAIRDGTRAAWFNPGDQRLLTMLGDFNRAFGDGAAAKTWYDKSEALGETIGARLGLAYLHDDAGREAEAEEALNWVITKEPGHVTARFRLGVVLGRSEDKARLDKALAIMTKIVEERPEFRDAYYELSKLYRREGNDAKAEEATAMFRKLEDERNERAKLPIEH